MKGLILALGGVFMMALGIYVDSPELVVGAMMLNIIALSEVLS